MVTSRFAVVIGTVGGILIAGPRVLSSIACRTLWLVQAHQARHDGQLANIVWSQSMKKGLADALISLLHRRDFAAGMVAFLNAVGEDQSLKRTITLGVLEALRDSAMQAEVKDLVMKGMQDKELQDIYLKVAISIVKTGIRESMVDQELKQVIKTAIREAMTDDELKGLLRGALKEALGDEELHYATLQGLQGAVNSRMNPFKRRQSLRVERGCNHTAQVSDQKLNSEKSMSQIMHNPQSVMFNSKSWMNWTQSRSQLARLRWRLQGLAAN
eukprot:gnl/MRDRNA2_/MRDRNA2_79919_c0_seq1.p1 gnl/MRDRNA2_/MRDRNA2_79919_c0~~gnl/MRDRNA2_/MRDRNA2_79919_c0_seq1.p1  ORF type:complete len:271 (+),score=47.78 gnl/MRDRNA2_/MRDRNA2_79919_c0_seq1:136-948(+)